MCVLGAVISHSPTVCLHFIFNRRRNILQRTALPYAIPPAQCSPSVCAALISSPSCLSCSRHCGHAGSFLFLRQNSHEVMTYDLCLAFLLHRTLYLWIVARLSLLLLSLFLLVRSTLTTSLKIGNWASSDQSLSSTVFFIIIFSSYIWDYIHNTHSAMILLWDY